MSIIKFTKDDIIEDYKALKGQVACLEFKVLEVFVNVNKEVELTLEPFSVTEVPITRFDTPFHETDKMVKIKTTRNKKLSVRIAIGKREDFHGTVIEAIGG